MTSTPPARVIPRVGVHLTAVFAAYLLAALACTWPLVRVAGVQIANDPGDPLLNTAILQWNATTLPFSERWWNPPHYFPTDGVAAFTENLVGLNLLFSPIYWATGNQVLAYNLTYFLSWPLCAWAMFLLVRELTGNRPAAFLAGLAFAFSPYRTTEISHIQMLSAYWLPILLLALHRFMRTGRRRWLAAFGAAWIIQSLCNGHYLLFGGLLIAIWLAYFGSPRARWQRTGSASVAWMAASLPLAPILWRYREIHAQFGLHRTIEEIVAFSAQLRGFLEVTGDVWLWGGRLLTGSANLFPGLTAPLVVIVSLWFIGRRQRDPALPARRRALRALAWLMLLAAAGVALTMLATGPWSLRLAGVSVRVTSIDRALFIVTASFGALLALTPWWRQALRERNALVFYLGSTALFAVLCFGPVIRSGDSVSLARAPYQLLLLLPGFNELRVPSRFWMLGVMTLSVATGICLARLKLSAGPRRALTGLVAIGLLADGWIVHFPMAAPAAIWTDAEPADKTHPILELPIGPAFDWNATFRAATHRRRVLNGVSGYDPPHYDALVTALQERDPAILAAIATLGPFDIVVDRTADPDGSWLRYAAAAPGAVIRPEAGSRTVVEVPQQTTGPGPGPRLPIARVDGTRVSELFSRREADLAAVHDGRLATGWSDVPQRPGQWLVVDLGREQTVGGVSLSLGDRALAFPRQLAIETSHDGRMWQPLWNGRGAPYAFTALVSQPREAILFIPLPVAASRYLRVLQVGTSEREWHVAEIGVHEPSR